MDWKVFKTQIKLLKHPNADTLDLINASGFQFVSKTGTYKDKDYAIVIPDKSILPDSIKPFFIDYLKGPEKNRVGEIRIRGCESQGILLSAEKIKEIANLNIDEIELDVDISAKLGITKYEPPIPLDMAGQLELMANRPQIYDSNQFASNSDQFEDGELIYITEKLHGASCYILAYPDGSYEITTKNQAKKDYKLTESETNKYWVALRNHKEFFDKVSKNIFFTNNCKVLEFACELLPVQKGFTYGFASPTVKVFGMAVKSSDGWSRFSFVTLKMICEDMTVPHFYIGQFRKADIPKYIALAEGKETVSGKELHIKEGVVIAPVVPRKDKGGTYISMKILNTKYKNDGEELS